MEYVKSILALLLLGSSLCGIPAFAQDTTNSLTIASPVNGEISAGSTQDWRFNAVDGQVLSFAVNSTSGDLDPRFTITNSKGEPFLSNDDYAYPDNLNALLEAVTMPRLDTYTVTVSGTGQTAGSYNLTMQSGFSQTVVDDNFNGSLAWEAMTPSSADFTVTGDGGQIALAVTGSDITGIAIDPQQIDLSDFYARVNVNVSGGQDGWVVGMTLRQQDADNYYLLNVRSRGEWRFLVHENGVETVIRDWIIHPALANSTGTFTLGVMADASGFDFFYNDVLFGRLSNTILAKAGKIGLSVRTSAALTSQTTAHFDDLIVSVPTLADGKRIIPNQVSIGQPAVMTRDLQRRGLIPATGQLSLTVPESFIESARPGIDRVSLARGATYRNLAMGTTVSWDAAGDGLTGCGLVLQAKDDTNYTLAYVDHSGGYGVSQRQGNQFTPGIFAENTAHAGNQHALLVILRGETLLFYVDGLLGGSMSNSPTEGSIGNAVINFEPIRTSCKFTDTWVWNWDN